MKVGIFLKETIYTIPINDAFDTKCDCPLCVIENKIDTQYTEDALGAGMMEPDLRIVSNEKGYCKMHYKQMMSMQKALPLSLVLQSHSEHYNKKLNTLLKNVSPSKGLFKKDNQEYANKIIEYISEMSGKCFICDKTRETLDRYANNIIYLWKTDEEFKKKFEEQKGFCLPHFALLLKYAKSELGSNNFTEFYNKLIESEKTALNCIYSDISDFTKLFDYRSEKKPSDNVKNAIKRTVQKYSGAYEE